MPTPPEHAQRARSPAEGALANVLSLVVLTAVSLVTFGYQRALGPLYGSSPTQHHLNKVVWVACIFGSFTPTLPMLPAMLTSGILLTAMPYTSYWVAAYTGRMGDVILGPLVTHVVVIAPVLILGVALVKILQEGPHQNGSTASAPYQTITVPVSRMAIMSLQEIWLVTPFLKQVDDVQIFRSVGGIALAFWVFWPFIQTLRTGPRPAITVQSNPPSSIPKKKRNKTAQDAIVSSTASRDPPLSLRSYWRILLVPIFFAADPILHPPTLAKPLLDPYTHPTAPLRVLSSVRSEYSGIVLVGEVLPPSAEAVRAGNVKEPHSLRYLRAGHSLLGGVWIGDRVYRRDGKGPISYDGSGFPLGDSIYSAFVMQEAVRLFETSDGRPRKEALIIGLGAGIASTAFVRHNLSTTVVEIDPAVYEAAQRYFGLAVPEPHNLFLEDARRWVHRRKMQAEHPAVASDPDNKPPLFDIVVHDCFSGGGVPGHIFTTEFWWDLRRIMRDDGVVAVNFAGKMSSQSFRAIFLTLMEVFPQCRAFHDSMEPISQGQLNDEFVNWVFFCTPSSESPALRQPTESDYLNSFLRERVLSTLQNQEVALEEMRDATMTEKEKRSYVLTDQHNPLVRWQQEEALHHWGLMRKVLPHVFWETY